VCVKFEFVWRWKRNSFSRQDHHHPLFLCSVLLVDSTNLACERHGRRRGISSSRQRGISSSIRQGSISSCQRCTAETNCIPTESQLEYWTFQQNRNYYKRDNVPNGIATRIAITCRRIYSRLLHQALQAPKLLATTIRVLIIAVSN